MVAFSVLSRPGGRDVNEDALAHWEGPNGHLFLVCDGLGGHGAGEVASAMAARAAEQVFFSAPLSSEDLLRQCVVRANEAIVQEQQRLGRSCDMKTTITLLALRGGTARWAHVGDSRIYLFCGSKLISRTLDHSVPQMLVAQGQLREKHIRFHEDRNRLTRVLGMDAESPRIELSEELLPRLPARFLLCSDGFWELIDEKEMCRLLKKSDRPETWLQAMEQVILANGKNGHMDNYSAIAVYTDD